MIHLPAELEAILSGQLGSSYEHWKKSLSEPPPVSIRINPIKATVHHFSSRVPWCRTGYYLPERPVFTLDPHFHAGAYYVQEASSMFLEQAFLQLIDGAAPLNVLDLSAAPGGKSTHILGLLNPNSLLVSNEVIRSRATILSENIQKWGYSNVLITNNDPEDFQSFKDFFDVILIDAPCSGEGLFRKDPAAVQQWSSDNVALCARRQQRIIHDIWPALKQDGLLMYSTCTFNPEENENNLIRFAEAHALEFIPLQLHPEWNVEEVNSGGVIGYRFYPHRVAGEGFFISVLKKKEVEETEKVFSKKQTLAPVTKKTLEGIQRWVHTPAHKTFIIHKDRVQFFPVAKRNEIEGLITKLNIVSAGTNVCTIKQGKFIPEHSLALSVELNKEHFTTIDLTQDDALKYLRKDVLQLNTSEKGYALVAYKNIPLGWVNILPNRVNNLYPSEWRIRMSKSS